MAPLRGGTSHLLAGTCGAILFFCESLLCAGIAAQSTEKILTFGLKKIQSWMLAPQAVEARWVTLRVVDARVRPRLSGAFLGLLHHVVGLFCPTRPASEDYAFFLAPHSTSDSPAQLRRESLHCSVAVILFLYSPGECVMCLEGATMTEVLFVGRAIVFHLCHHR